LDFQFQEIVTMSAATNLVWNRKLNIFWQVAGKATFGTTSHFEE
jgi:hypothetical protein